MGFSSVVVVDEVDVEAGVRGVTPSLMISDVLGDVGAACVCRLGPPNTAATTVYTKKNTATAAIAAATRRATYTRSGRRWRGGCTGARYIVYQCKFYVGRGTKGLSGRVSGPGSMSSGKFTSTN